GKKMAAVIGAGSDEVIINDATCINLYKVAAAAWQHQAPRRKIITDNLNFPSDIYIFQGLAGPENVVVVNSEDGLMGPVAGLQAALDEETAVISLSHTVFKSGYTYDMAAINKMAHDVGALVIWDMSHSVGSVPTFLNESNADLAVGCTYKYMNGGPGAPAFVYCRRDLQPLLHNPITGWFGHANRYDFALDYSPAAGMRKFITGTPTILSIAAIEPGVDLTLAAGMDRIRTKSVALSEFFIELWEAWLAPLGFSLNSPRAARWRGAHVSIGHDKAKVIDRALVEELKVIPDFRPPSNIRFGLAPLYTTFNDCLEAVVRTKRVMDEQLYAKYEDGVED
ncbi:MAG: aminotransferase class V-fold PLP-dependent enzyme, partial [Chloroflexota bacterium]